MKSISLSTEMVEAILEGRKTTFRRNIKPQPTFSKNSGYNWGRRAFGIGFTDGQTLLNWTSTMIEFHSSYKVGDTLYVREKFNDEETDSILYAADKEFIDYGCKKVDGFLFMEGDIEWKPASHMPRDAARIFLTVTQVRIERLRHMNVNDFLREGIMPIYGVKTACELVRTHAEKFKTYWDNTIAKEDIDKYGYDANPWVWVIEFEVQLIVS